MKKIFQKILFVLAHRCVVRYKPIVIGITGSVGKTTTKEAVALLLKQKFKVWQNKKNFNNELGVAMTILGIDPNLDSLLSKFLIIPKLFQSLVLAYGPLSSTYPEVLVLEMAADKPGDIKYLTKMARPKIGIVTALGEMPVHIAAYASLEAVQREKAELIKSLPEDGLAILNKDDPNVISMQNDTGAQVITFGLHKGGQCYTTDIRYFFQEADQMPAGLAVDVRFLEDSFSIQVPNMLNKNQLYSILPAIAVAMHLGIEKHDILKALDYFDVLPGRGKLLAGINGSFLIDDSYNASPLSVSSALDTLQDAYTARNAQYASSGKRIVILGDMLELGRFSKSAHEIIGEHAAHVADLLIVVGNYAQDTARGAMNILAIEQIKTFPDSRVASGFVVDYLMSGDIVLIKGSQSSRMERIAEVLLRDKKSAPEVLVRQSAWWKHH